MALLKRSLAQSTAYTAAVRSVLVTGWAAGLTAGLTTGCNQTPEPEFRLVGLYDASAVVALDPEAPQDFLWRPAPGMEASCGQDKGPEGIGMYDAELIGNRMSPTLAIVLEHAQPIDDYMEEQRQKAFAEAIADATASNESPPTEEAFNLEWQAKRAKELARPAVTPNEVTVALGQDSGVFMLQPAVLPRNISVRIDGDETNLRYQQLVRTQLEVEMCMEHKVGRGWSAATGEQLRQAFLLNEPEGVTRDRRYFGGQRDPVAPYLAAPDACLFVSESLSTTPPENPSRGDSSTDLVPSDIWGAMLRECSTTEGGGDFVDLRAQQREMLPLSLTEYGDTQAITRGLEWSAMTVEVGSGERDEDINVTVTYENNRLGDDWEPLIMDDEPLFRFMDETDEEGRKKGGMIDLMAAIPHTYPTVGPRYDPDRYVVLLVPNWQVVEGLRRLYDRVCVDTTNMCTCTVTSRNGSFTCRDQYNEPCELVDDAAREECSALRNPSNPMRSMLTGEMDGVGWILENPELLYLQVNTMEEEEPDPDDLNPYDGFVSWYNQSCAKFPGPLACEKDDLQFTCDDPADEEAPPLDFSCAQMSDAGTDLFCSFPVPDPDDPEAAPSVAELDCTLNDLNTLRRDSFNRPELTCTASDGTSQINYSCTNTARKPNLAVAAQGGTLGIQDWGYVSGQKVGRTPVVLPLPEAGEWTLSREAHRGRQHTMFIVMFGTLVGFLVYGLRRLPDLWTRTPEERAYYWPGRQSQKEQEEVDPEGVESNAESNEGG